MENNQRNNEQSSNKDLRRERSLTERRATLFTGPDVLASSKGATMHTSQIAIHTNKVSKYVLKQDMSAADMEKMVWRRKRPDGTLEPVDFNTVLKESKFGGYQVILIIVCGIIFMSYSCSMTSLSIIIPASCPDLGISTFQAGIINMTLLAGMIVGIYVWGPLSDSLGRKTTLMCCLALDFGAAVVAGFSVSKWMLLACRFFSGFGIIGAGSLIFPYCGEFLEDRKRDAVLAVLELFWILGIVYVPAIAWGILGLTFKHRISPSLNFVPWRLVCIMTGFPSLAGFLLLFFMPETPRFLMSVGKLNATEKVVKKIYLVNTRKQQENYPVVLLADSIVARRYFQAEGKITFSGMLLYYIQCIAKTHSELFKKIKTVGKIFQVCIIDFGASYSYITLVMWIPVMLSSWSTYTAETGSSSTTLCRAFSSKPPDENTCRNMTSHVYRDTMIISAACLPSVALLLVAIIYINKKPLLFSILMLASGSSLGLHFANNNTVFMVASIFFESFSSLVESVVILCIIDIFPVHLRGTVTALAVIAARIGAIVGNILMGLLLERHCPVMLYSFFGTFFVAGIIVLTLPRMHHGYLAF